MKYMLKLFFWLPIFASCIYGAEEKEKPILRPLPEQSFVVSAEQDDCQAICMCVEPNTEVRFTKIEALNRTQDFCTPKEGGIPKQAHVASESSDDDDSFSATLVLIKNPEINPKQAFYTLKEEGLPEDSQYAVEEEFIEQFYEMKKKLKDQAENERLIKEHFQVIDYMNEKEFSFKNKIATLEAESLNLHNIIDDNSKENATLSEDNDFLHKQVIKDQQKINELNLICEVLRKSNQSYEIERDNLTIKVKELISKLPDSDTIMIKSSLFVDMNTKIQEREMRISQLDKKIVEILKRMDETLIRMNETNLICVEYESKCAEYESIIRGKNVIIEGYEVTIKEVDKRLHVAALEKQSWVEEKINLKHAARLQREEFESILNSQTAEKNKILEMINDEKQKEQEFRKAQKEVDESLKEQLDNWKLMHEDSLTQVHLEKQNTQAVLAEQARQQQLSKDQNKNIGQQVVREADRVVQQGNREVKRILRKI